MDPFYPLWTMLDFHEQVVHELDRESPRESAPIDDNHCILDIFLTYALELGYEVPDIQNILDDPGPIRLTEAVTRFVNTDLVLNFISILTDSHTKSPNILGHIKSFAELLYLTAQHIPIPLGEQLRDALILAPATLQFAKLITCPILSAISETDEVVKLYTDIISPKTNLIVLNQVLSHFDVMELTLIVTRCRYHHSALALNALAYISMLDNGGTAVDLMLDYLDDFIDILVSGPPFIFMAAIIRFVYFLSLRNEFMQMEDIWISAYLGYTTRLLEADSELLPYVVGTVYNISNHVLAGIPTELSFPRIQAYFCETITSTFSYDTMLECELPRDMAYLTGTDNLADLVTKLMHIKN